MKKIVSLSLLLSVAALVYSFAGETKEESWFDMKNCEMCVAMSSTPHLMENMTWEHFNVSNGMMTVTTINGDFVDAYRTSEAKMGETVEKLQAGKETKLCNACTAYGALMAQGAKYEKFDTMHGSVSMLSSDNPETIAMIQDWGNKTNSEMEKMHTSEDNHLHQAK